MPLKFHLVLHVRVDGIGPHAIADLSLVCDKHQMSIRRAGVGDERHGNVALHKVDTRLDQVALGHLRGQIHLEPQSIAVSHFIAGSGSPDIEPVGIALVVGRCRLVHANGIGFRAAARHAHFVKRFGRERVRHHQVLQFFALSALAGCGPIFGQKQVAAPIAQAAMHARDGIRGADPRIGHAIGPKFVALVKPAQFQLQILRWPKRETPGKRQIVRPRGDKGVGVVVKSRLFGAPDRGWPNGCVLP